MHQAIDLFCVAKASVSDVKTSRTVDEVCFLQTFNWLDSLLCWPFCRHLLPVHAGSTNAKRELKKEMQTPSPNRSSNDSITHLFRTHLPTWTPAEGLRLLCCLLISAQFWTQRSPPGWSLNEAISVCTPSCAAGPLMSWLADHSRRKGTSLSFFLTPDTKAIQGRFSEYNRTTSSDSYFMFILHYETTAFNGINHNNLKLLPRIIEIKHQNHNKKMHWHQTRRLDFCASGSFSQQTHWDHNLDFMGHLHQKCRTQSREITRDSSDPKTNSFL